MAEARDVGGDAAAVRAARMHAQAQKAAPREVRLVAHSNILYWWVVWLYGYVCAFATYINHVAVPFAGKQIKFFPEAWLGISYIAVVLFVIVFTNVRARVLHTFIIASIIALALVGIEWKWSLGSVFSFLPEIRVHMNLAFYVLMSTGLLTIWIIVVFGIDHLTYWRFGGGQVVERHRLGNAAGNVYDTRGMLMRRNPDDLFRHKLLGLGFLGLGTGDVVFKPAMAGSEPFIIENVWRSNEKQRRIERLLIQSGGSS
jgi:hypothetical protein